MMAALLSIQSSEAGCKPVLLIGKDLIPTQSAAYLSQTRIYSTNPVVHDAGAHLR